MSSNSSIGGGGIDILVPAVTQAPRCTLLNGAFNDFVQIMLGLIALSVLIFKRYHESPRRPLRIWMFDASKQLIGAGVAHAANLTIAIVLTGLAKGRTDADQCAFYFVNFTMDTTFGVAVNYALLRLLVLFAIKYGVSALQVPGDYGHPIQVRLGSPALHLACDHLHDEGLDRIRDFRARGAAGQLGRVDLQPTGKLSQS
ncbi:hypothetical protein Ae201684P_021813 [Aphanomyces euteiches]|nr:hypothetical protein Ae201684P_021813 [Aphanomyces euteiches]